MMKLRTHGALALALTLLTAGCASGGRGSDPGSSAEQVTIVVENNVAPPVQVLIYAVSTQGARQSLGSVPPGTTRTLRFRAGSFLGSYRFVANAGFNQELTSNALPLSGGETVVWQLNTNTAFIR
jgi:hypothetical protein